MREHPHSHTHQDDRVGNVREYFAFHIVDKVKQFVGNRNSEAGGQWHS